MAEAQPRVSLAGLKAAAAYTAMLVALVLIYLPIRSLGGSLHAPAPTTTAIFGSAASLANTGELLHFLIALVVVIATARVLGSIFRSVHQPPVIGEIIAGILLGPSLLGRFAPGISAYVFPAGVGPFLNMLSQVGVILYMFLVGLELDPALLRKRGHTTVAISHASIIAPFLLGAAISLLLYPRLSTSDVPFTCFSLFLGVSMSVTAFPVLARILTDRGIHKTRMGAIALTCAAVDDVTAWCLLAFVVSVARAQATGAFMTIGLALGFILVMVLVVRPGMVRLSLLYGNRGRLTQGVMASVFVALLLSASATEMIGIHAVFGAFALGAVIPHDSGMARDLTDRLEDIVIVLLLPAFFAYTGLRTQIGLVSGAEQWGICALIVAVASIGKFGGSAIAARFTGLNWRDASALGVLMNTRGLMELIVLNIGLEMKVISPTLFAMLVIMALVTTFATTPILHFITRRMEPETDAIPEEFSGAPALEAASVGAPQIAARSFEPASRVATPARPILVGTERSAILVPVSNPEGVPDLVELALAATPHDAPAPRVLALVKTPPGGVRSGLREVEQRVPPRSLALAAALDLALARGNTITPQAVWSNDPAADILSFAHEPQIGWLLLGSHRSVFGSDFMGGVVREILDKVRTMPVHVAVLIHGGQRPLERVFALLDHGADGRAALDLALRVAQRKKANLHAIVMPGHSDHADDSQLLDLIREASRALGRRVPTDVLTALTSEQLSRQTPGGMVVLASNLADRLKFSREAFADGKRCVVIVQGSPHASARYTTFSATSVAASTDPSATPADVTSTGSIR